MVTLAALASIVFYFIPLIVIVTVNSDRKRSALELALDIPLSVSADLILVSLLSFVFRLDTATWVSRALWLAGGGALIVWKRRRAGWRLLLPAISSRELAGVVGSTALSVFLSATISRTYQIWDRYWHIALTASLRGQRLPFQNVYEPGGHLQYHWAADFTAAMMQTLSFCTISSDMALAQAHDIAFGCIGATIALLLIGVGQTRALPLALSGAAVLLHGPLLLRSGAGNNPLHDHGYSWSYYATNSFRPNVALGGVLLTGFVGAVAVRLKGGGVVSHRRTLAVLFATSAAFTITDEASLALVGVGLFATWLVDNRILLSRRDRGFAVLIALAIVVVVARGVLVGFRGGPVEKIEWASSAIPGLSGAVTEVFTKGGMTVLFCDFFPFLAATVGLALAMFERPSRPLAAAIVFSAANMFLCFVGLTHLAINGARTEVLRFFEAPCFVALILGLMWIPSLRRGGAARIAILGALILPAVFSVIWIREIAPVELASWTLRGPFESTPRGAYGYDCRQIAGARLGQTPELTYIDTPGWYRYAACRPIFAPGMIKLPWRVKIGARGQWYPNTQIGDITEMAGPNGTVPAICFANGESSDPVCKYALAHSSCTPAGTDFVRCPLTPDLLADLKTRHIEQDAGWH